MEYAPQQAPSRFPHFRAHKRLVDPHVLTTLSHEGMKVFLYACYRWSLLRGYEVEVADQTIQVATGLTQEQVDAARYECSVVGLMTYELRDDRVNYILIP